MSKIRPYVSEVLVNDCRELYPRFKGNDGAFIDWILQSFSAGALTFGGAPLPLPTQAMQQPLHQQDDEDDLIGEETD